MLNSALLSIKFFLPLMAYVHAPGEVKSLIESDYVRWMTGANEHWRQSPQWKQFLLVFRRFPEYRNVFRYRLRKAGTMWTRIIERRLRLFYYGERTLLIGATRVGKGLRIQHGFCTLIVAKSLGDNCWINQQVTIGHTSPTEKPTVGNNVSVYAGAKVLGDIVIGDNVVIGANAVVVKDVPSNCTVVGVPGRIIKRDGKRVNENL